MIISIGSDRTLFFKLYGDNHIDTNFRQMRTYILKEKANFDVSENMSVENFCIQNNEIVRYVILQMIFSYT